MAAKEHTTFWGWASDHWFLTFLLVSSALAIPKVIAESAADAVNPRPPGPTPFPSSPSPPGSHL